MAPLLGQSLSWENREDTQPTHHGVHSCSECCEGVRVYRRALELVRVGQKASLRKNEKESFRSWVWRMFGSQGTACPKVLRKSLVCLRWCIWMEWNERSRGACAERWEWGPDRSLDAELKPPPNPQPPRSALFRNSTNLKSFPSDHLIKQDYPDLSRVWNLPVERLWLQELNQLGIDSTDPYLVAPRQIQWRLYPSVWSWRLWRDYCTGHGSVHVCVTVYHLLIIF